MATNTIYTDYYSILSNSYTGKSSSASSTSSTDASSMLSNWMYSGSVKASEASYRTKTKEALASAVSESGKTFLVDAKTGAEDIISALNSINSSSRTKKAAASGDENLLSIRSVDSGKVTSTADMTVQINQIAANQKNGATGLQANAATAITSGSMLLTVGSKDYNIDYSVSAGDTNREAQQKIADAINGANAGVKASVAYDSETGKSTLTLESTKTGTNAGFAISDATGNAVEQTGLDVTTQSAKNAQYRVNGGTLQTSQSNDVDLGNGIAATLKGVTGDKDVTVGISGDASDLIKDVKSLAEAFNSLLEAASENKSDSRTNKLYAQLTSLTKAYGDSLNRIGISVSGDGSLKVDDDKLAASAKVGELYQTSDLEKFFVSSGTGGSVGFTNRLNGIAEKVSNNTLDYVSTVSSASSNRFTPSQAATYNQYASASLLFDYLA